MYLFVRTRTCAPDRMAEAAAFAGDMATRVSSVTGLELAAWQVAFGAPVGTFSWTTTVESHADLATATEKLATDAGYLDAVERGADMFVGPAEDSLVDIVGTVGDGGHHGDVVDLVTARCANGKMGEAMAWGMEMMQHVSGLTGRDGVFTRSMYGPWGVIGWISMADSFAQLDEATAVVASDPEYVSRIDAASHLFMPGSGEGRLSRRIG